MSIAAKYRKTPVTADAQASSQEPPKNTAKEKLNELGFYNITVDYLDSDQPRDQVIRQSVAPNTVIRLTDEIVLTASNGALIPEEPDDPAQPTVPTAPEVPEDPADPENPDASVTPSDPTVPTQPVEPEQPAV